MDRTVGRTRIGLRASYGNPGLTFSGSELMITDKAAARLFEGSVLASFQVVGIGGGRGSSGAIRAEVGPALHLWKSGDELRKRLAALGSLRLRMAGRRTFLGRDPPRGNDFEIVV